MLQVPRTQLTSTLRSFRALALQLMRSTVTPENRVDVIQGVICLAYMVRGSGPSFHIHQPASAQAA